MDNGFPLDVDEQFWQTVVDKLESETDYGREEIERGLTFMLGRRARTMLQSIRDDGDLLDELDVAISHSRDEK